MDLTLMTTPRSTRNRMLFFHWHAGIHSVKMALGHFRYFIAALFQKEITDVNQFYTKNGVDKTKPKVW